MPPIRPLARPNGEWLSRLREPSFAPASEGRHGTFSDEHFSNRFRPCLIEGNPESPYPGTAMSVALLTGYNILSYPLVYW